MTAKEFKEKNRWRRTGDCCCGNCRCERVKLWQDGLETRVATSCAANGEGKKRFATFNWNVCDAWKPLEEKGGCPLIGGCDADED